MRFNRPVRIDELIQCYLFQLLAELDEVIFDESE